MKNENKSMETDASASEWSDLLDAGHAVMKNGVVFNISEKLWQSEEFESCMISMDKLNVPREKDGKVLSLFGRAFWMSENNIFI